MRDVYILDEDRNPVLVGRVDDMLANQLFAKFTMEFNYGRYDGDALPRIGLDTFDGISISTVMLPFDHGFSGTRLQLFETMINWGQEWDDQVRYSTYDDAVEGHKRAIDKVLKHIVNKAQNGNTENDQSGSSINHQGE